MSARKIYQLEGVRAIGALIVFICHFQIILVPKFYENWYTLMYLNGRDAFGKLNWIGTAANANGRLAHSISNFTVLSSNLMINGNLVLHIFWALSAYVIFKKFFEYGTTESMLISSSVKRYFRLMIPCAVSIFFSYIIYKAGLIYVTKLGVKTLQENLYTIPPTFIHALRTSVWSTLFNYDYYDSYNGPLWTIQREFYGSIFCFALFGVVGRNYKRGFIYLLLFLCVGLLKMYWLNSFLFGYFLADYDFTPTNSLKVKQLIARINTWIDTHQLLTVFAVLCAFIVCKMIIYKHIEWMDMINSFLCYLVILITFRIRVVSALMSRKVLTALGKVSFGIYVLHWPILCSFSSWLYLRHPDHNNAFIFLLFFLSLSLTILLSWIFYKLVDMKSISLAGKISKRFNAYITTKPEALQH